ncbi:DUF1097 family protein [Georgenia sp. H159]|uniref:DUF1097 family protein n=1 Tax=Georgenia sp. H159 TaxID=3076115 RepID=UPI002D7A0FA3|nr:DUF1097 family protein [Georgenia sp. H159]
MSATTSSPTKPDAVTSSVSSRARRVLPPEIAATILAVCATILGAVSGLPVYGVFLGWAAAGLAGGSRAVRTPVLVSCLTTGAVLGTGALAAASALGQIVGPDVPQWLGTVAALIVINPLMILLGRTRALTSVPAMFIGFSTLFAVHLGGTASTWEGMIGVLVATVLTNSIGVGCHRIFGHLTWSGGPATPA